MEDINQHVKNTYVIRSILSRIRKESDARYFEYWVGNKFRVTMFPRPVQDDGITDHEELSVVQFANVDVSVYECKRRENESDLLEYVYLNKDDRFCNYEPIKYHEYSINDGRSMPINHLCELVKYLHILAKLSAFL